MHVRAVIVRIGKAFVALGSGVSLLGNAAMHFVTFFNVHFDSAMKRVMAFVTILTVISSFVVLASSGRTANDIMEARHGPRWQRVGRNVFFVLLAYGIASFVLDVIWRNGLASPEFQDGRWALVAHGVVLREITADEARRHGAYVIRGMSAVFLAFSFGTVLVLLASFGGTRSPAVREMADDSDRRSAEVRKAVRSRTQAMLRDVLIGRVLWVTLACLIFARIQWLLHGTLGDRLDYLAGAWLVSYIGWVHALNETVRRGELRIRFANRRCVQWLTRVEWLWFASFLVAERAAGGIWVFYVTLAHLGGVIALRTCKLRRSVFRAVLSKAEATSLEGSD